MTHGNFAVDYEQRPYNPERMRRERLERAHAAMNKYGLGAMIVYSFDSQRYLGYYSHHQYGRRNPGTYVLLVKDNGFPYAPADPFPPMEESIMPWFKSKMVLKTSHHAFIFKGYPQKPEYMFGEWDKVAAEVKGLLQKHGVFNMPCGIDMTGFHMIDACQRAGIKLVDCNHVMSAARIVKTDDEVECLKMAGTFAESAHWEVCRALKPGVTEMEMAGVAANALYKLGAEEMEGPSFVVCSGDRVVETPAMPSDRIVRPGDLFVIDINGVGFQGYRTCFYRTYCVGDKPTEYQKDIYSRAVEGFDALTNSIKAGLTNQEVQQAWMEKGNAPGKWGRRPKWPEPGYYYRGSMAHHIGLTSGDPGPEIGLLDLKINEKADAGALPPPLMLEKNMTFAVEVGCWEWDGNKWNRDGVKLEHCGRVTETGYEVFYRFPYKDLIACGLPGIY
jgi:Xaa-Pro aminopeptidase